MLLPGLNGTDGLFAPLLKAMSDDTDVRIIAYPTQELKTYPELTSLVLEELKSIEGEYVLLGESLSGPISLFVSDKRPTGLIGIVLVSTFITAPNIRMGRFLPWQMGFAMTRPLYGLRRMLSKSADSQFIDSISVELQKVKASVLAFRVQQIFSVDATESLKRCTVPIVYFRGTKDNVVPRGNLKQILAIKPEISVVEFDTQHFLLQSEPAKACDEIMRFCSGLKLKTLS